MLEIRGALAERGAEVAIATHGGPFRTVLDAAGVAYDLIGDGVSDERAARFVRSVPGVGPPDQSMWSTTSCSSGRRPRSTTSAAAACLSSSRAGRFRRSCRRGSREFRSSRSTPGRGCRPCSSTACSLRRSSRSASRSSAGSRGAIVRRMFNSGVANFSAYTDGFNRAAAQLDVAGLPSFASLLLGDLTLVTDVPALLGVAASDMEAWRPRDPARTGATRDPLCRPDLRPHAHPAARSASSGSSTGPGPIVYVAITSTGPDLVRAAVEGVRATAGRASSSRGRSTTSPTSRTPSGRRADPSEPPGDAARRRSP